jgi:GntR family transcriptional regulator
MPEWRIARRPLTLQVRDQVLEIIKNNHLLPGDRLPSEAQLAEQFGVSRAALRETFKLMEEERLVACRHGVGRFVAPQVREIYNEDITRLQSVSELAANLGMKLTSEVLSVQEIPADDALAAALEIETGAPVINLERVWRDAESPIIYCNDYFRKTLLNTPVTPEYFSGSLLAKLEKNQNLRISYSKTVIQAVRIQPQLLERLGVASTRPWIYLEQLNFDVHDHPLLFSRDYFYSEKFQFRVLRRRR